VSHASELVYVFGTIPAEATKETREVSEAMVRYWTQFAKTGDPNQAGLPEWPAFQKGNEAYLEIAQPIRAEKDLNLEKADLFTKIVRTAARN
jgi:para-nitrobenzyl esterase